jgi:hypothetical protein
MDSAASNALEQFTSLDNDCRLRVIEGLVFEMHWLLIGQWSSLQLPQSGNEMVTVPSPSVPGHQSNFDDLSERLELPTVISASQKRRQRSKSVKAKMWCQL